MTKILSNLMIIGCLLLGLSVISCGQNKSVDPKDFNELEKIYKEFDEAGKKLDISVIEKYLDDNYEMHDGKTTYNRAEIIKRVKENFAAIEEVIESTSKIEKVEIKDGNYHLEISSLLTATFKLPNGKTAKVETNTKSTDVWRKTNRGWKEITQILRSLKILVDGKELPQ